MNAAKHTPGPWGLSSESPKIIKQFDGLGETPVILGSASGWDGSWCFPSDATALANARLIAAAPELLEALIDCREALRRAGAAGELTIVNNAIAKATGSAA